ncbi:hypothetical protein TNCV_3551841 [Trichonephila clavipes]|nr:hypothetical protein TNCV_3551841 [Trichonephila clavipes]
MWKLAVVLAQPTNQEAPSESRPLHFKAQIHFDMEWRNVSRSISQRCQAFFSTNLHHQVDNACHLLVPDKGLRAVDAAQLLRENIKSSQA